VRTTTIDKHIVTGLVINARWQAFDLPRIDYHAGGLETLIIMGIAVAQGQGGKRLICLALTTAGGLETLIMMGIAVAQWQSRRYGC
jgi:hypothetical protein